MPVWLSLPIRVPLMSEPPEPGAHVRLSLLRGPRQRQTRVYAVLRPDYGSVRFKPRDVELVVLDAHREGRAIRVEVAGSRSATRTTRVELRLEIDTTWAQEFPSIPRV